MSIYIYISMSIFIFLYVYNITLKDGIATSRPYGHWAGWSLQIKLFVNSSQLLKFRYDMSGQVLWRLEKFGANGCSRNQRNIIRGESDDPMYCLELSKDSFVNSFDHVLNFQVNLWLACWYLVTAIRFLGNQGKDHDRRLVSRTLPVRFSFPWALQKFSYWWMFQSPPSIFLDILYVTCVMQ